MDNNELQHWGIRGMKWGIRRYQNADGTLTNAGKKRYNKEMEKLKEEERVLKNKQKTQAKLDKLEAKRKELDDLKNPKKKTSTDADDENVTTSKKKSQLTKEELQEKVERLALEARIKELELKINPPPPEAKKGEGIIKSIFKKTLENGVDLGKQYLSKEIEKRFKPETPEDPLSDLKKMVDEIGLREKIANSQKNIRANEWDKEQKDRVRKQQAEKDADAAAKKASEKAAAEAAKQDSAKEQRTKNVMDVMKDFDGPVKNYTPGGKYKVNFDLSEYTSTYKSMNERYDNPTNSDYANSGKSFVDDLIWSKDD